MAYFHNPYHLPFFVYVTQQKNEMFGDFCLSQIPSPPLRRNLDLQSKESDLTVPLIWAWTSAVTHENVDNRKSPT